MTTTKRKMALDVGDARIGVAVSDPLNIFSQPYTTVECKNLNKAIVEILSIVSSHNIGTIVVGIPKMLDGSEGEQALKVNKFISMLEKADANIEIARWDERFTTQQAEQYLIGSKLKNKEKSAALDRISASIILESYMSYSQK